MMHRVLTLIDIWKWWQLDPDRLPRYPSLVAVGVAFMDEEMCFRAKTISEDLYGAEEVFFGTPCETQLEAAHDACGLRILLMPDP